MTRRRPFERVVFIDAAIDDLRPIAARSPAVVQAIFRILIELDAGRVEPRPLSNRAKTGDLSDCGKIVVAVEGEPEYRIVTRHTERGMEVVEVIAVDARVDDAAYLLAGARLGRLIDPFRLADAQRIVALVRRRLGR